MTWTDILDDDQRREIALAKIYDDEWDPSRPARYSGEQHTHLMLIARLAELLDAALGIAVEQRVAEEAETIDRQRWRADGLATAAAIVVGELHQDGRVQPHSQSLLAAAVAAYEAGKGEEP